MIINPCPQGFYVNDRDPVLKPIWIPLPDIGHHEIESIENYGLPRDEQRFRKERFPVTLYDVASKCESTEQVWDVLQRNKVTYAKEISFIQEQWRYRKEGKWFIIDQTPTWISPGHWFYLNYWKIDVGYPQYRFRDAKFFHFAQFCEQDTMDFIEKDSEGWAVPDGTGQYRMLDTGRRICFGFNYPKGRREGATYKATSKNYNIISQSTNAWGGIQSMDGASAKKTFNVHLISPWKKVAFFFRPQSPGRSTPVSELVFDLPPQSQGASAAIIATGLESKIDFAESAMRGWYDGFKLYFLHNDECGKTIGEDVDARWTVQANCLSTGSKLNIHGLAINTSTVGEMSAQGGQNFYNLCLKSMYHKRGDNGQTESGLYNLFIPSDDGLEGFIDIFGNSVIEDPTPEQTQYIKNPVLMQGRIIGANTYLMRKRDHILASKADKAMLDYEEELRLYPMSFDECFVASGSGSGFNLINLQTRIQTIRYKSDNVVTGNFHFTDGHMSRVEFVENPQGRWKVSKLLSYEESNNWFTRNGIYYPGNAEKYTTCGDPFKFMNTEHKRMSMAGGATFMHRDESIDPQIKDISLYVTNRFVSDYLARPATSDDFVMDMIMECLYWGSMMYPEINHPVLWDGFVRNNMNGFLKYDKKPDGTYKTTPGFNSLDASKQRIFDSLRTYIELHCSRENHLRILEQCKSIKGVEDMKNWDLVTAAGGALMGATSDFHRYRKQAQNDSYDIGTYFGRRR